MIGFERLQKYFSDSRLVVTVSKNTIKIQAAY